MNSAGRHFDQIGGKFCNAIHWEGSEDGHVSSEGFFVERTPVLRDQAFDRLKVMIGQFNTEDLLFDFALGGQGGKAFTRAIAVGAHKATCTEQRAAEVAGYDNN